MADKLVFDISKLIWQIEKDIEQTKRDQLVVVSGLAYKIQTVPSFLVSINYSAFINTFPQPLFPYILSKTQLFVYLCNLFINFMLSAEDRNNFN